MMTEAPARKPFAEMDQGEQWVWAQEQLGPLVPGMTPECALALGWLLGMARMAVDHRCPADGGWVQTCSHGDYTYNRNGTPVCRKCGR